MVSSSGFLNFAIFLKIICYLQQNEGLHTQFQTILTLCKELQKHNQCENVTSGI